MLNGNSNAKFGNSNAKFGNSNANFKPKRIPALELPIQRLSYHLGQIQLFCQKCAIMAASSSRTCL
jgi:hypothetical protein